jgi:hypothetical protein
MPELSLIQARSNVDLFVDDGTTKRVMRTYPKSQYPGANPTKCVCTGEPGVVYATVADLAAAHAGAVANRSHVYASYDPAYVAAPSSGAQPNVGNPIVGILLVDT